MAESYRKVITLAVALIIVAVIFPIALGLIANAGNTIISVPVFNSTPVDTPLTDLIDPTVLVLLVVLLPIIAIIAVVMMFLPKSRKT